MNPRKTNILKLFYFVGAAIIVSACGESTQEQAPQQVLISNVQLVNMALKGCQAKLKKIVGREMYAPTETIGTGASSLVLKWNGDKEKEEFKTAACSYSMDHGMTSLVIDGRTVFEKKI